MTIANERIFDAAARDYDQGREHFYQLEGKRVARDLQALRDECDAGMIYWNGGSIAAESHLAFGGAPRTAEPNLAIPNGHGGRG